jgi:putative two-component system response regulator
MPGKVLVVEDDDANARFFTRLLARDGHAVQCARTGDEALDAMPAVRPDLVLTDVMLPGISGFEICRRIKSNPDTCLTPVVLVTALQSSQDRIEGLDAGADDFISKPLNSHELIARVRSLLRIKRYTDELDTAEAIFVSMALTIEARDATTDGHCQRLADYATWLGMELGLGPEELGALRRGGFLHDVGKIGIPDAILLKPSRLLPSEYEVMKQHTVIGDRLCGGLKLLQHVRPIVRHHHERLDGSGYPDGLRGDAIPRLAQIIGIVDVFDALTTVRPYKAAMTTEDACKELAGDVRAGWRDASLVAAFDRVIRTRGLAGTPRIDGRGDGDR